jgi:hypothetical protein
MKAKKVSHISETDIKSPIEISGCDLLCETNKTCLEVWPIAAASMIKHDHASELDDFDQAKLIKSSVQRY